MQLISQISILSQQPLKKNFSNAGLVQNDQRNRMEPSALNMIFTQYEKNDFQVFSQIDEKIPKKIFEGNFPF
ncbi:hypothetical protein BpHYR1_027976 [Brachionus plicatilis]|uniref:Uncharacterized protein n=1 Tax=Brachionus plicatilis TaxID=10195 RepID=A0A3M7RKB1_BRAPC|nr:hypothetical protein BpHYR1_027976 [Brachionus plicatilis]